MKILIVIDMQNDFIDGALGTPEAVEIVPAVAEKIRQYREAGNPVVFTRDTHGEDYPDTQEGQNLPVIHCVEGTSGWEISPQLPVENARIINKPSFGSLELADYVASFEQIDSIELVGLCTDICDLQCHDSEGRPAGDPLVGGCILLCRSYTGKPSECPGGNEDVSDHGNSQLNE